MDILAMLAQGFAVALSPLNIGLLLLGCFFGTLVGSLPGIGPINGVAILLPLAYSIGLPAESAIILLAGVYYGAEYGGRISSILLNVPGDASAVMTTLDGHPMAKRGEASRALALSALASFIGGTSALILMTIFAPLLGRVAVGFGPQDYVALMVFAFACLATLVGSRPLKTLIGVLIGLMLAMVGIDSGTGVMRFTFGIPNLFDGVEFLVVVIGLFAVSEALLMLETWSGKRISDVPLAKGAVKLGEILRYRLLMLRAAVIGFFIGVLPGTGASIASAVAYGVEKRLAQGGDDQFGKGDPRGLVAPETANNAAAAGAMVPMLTLGIPGSGTTAILLGALLLFNVTPGPLMFEQRPELAWGLIASMYLGNVALLILNLPLVGVFARLLSVPRAYLVPLMVALTFIGVFSLYGATFDLVMMIVLGFFGYLLRKMGFTLAPVILGLVLGALLETNLRRALSISDGDWSILISTPTGIVFWIGAALVAASPFVLKAVAHKRKIAPPLVKEDE